MKKAIYFIGAACILLGLSLISPQVSGGATKDALPAIFVIIELEGTPAVQVQLLSVKGIADEHEIIENKLNEKGGISIQKVPGRFKISDISIRKLPAPAANDPLYQWRRGVVDGKITRRNGSIVFYDARQQEVARYKFYNAWPSQWKGMVFDSFSAQGPFFEEFVLTVERVERVR
jgi:phage tail-like protein